MTKGRVAAEVEAIDELVVTELIFAGFFQQLDVPSVAAVCSAMMQMDKLKNGVWNVWFVFVCKQ